MVKGNNKLKMESFVPMTANKDLIAVSASPKNMTFKQTIWNFLISTSEDICIIRPWPFLPPLKKLTQTEMILPFANNVLAPQSFCLWKSSIFVQLLCLLDRMLPDLQVTE